MNSFYLKQVAQFSYMSPTSLTNLPRKYNLNADLEGVGS